MDGDFIIFCQYIFLTILHSMSTYQLCCSKSAFLKFSLVPFFLLTLQILTIVIRFKFMLVLRTRLTQRIFFIFIFYDSKSNCSIIISHLTTRKGSNASFFE